MVFDYSKLNGRIVEVLGTRAEFSRKMGISERSIHLKLNNKTYWKNNEIRRAIEILHIPIEDIGLYFFKLKVQEDEQL